MAIEIICLPLPPILTAAVVANISIMDALPPADAELMLCAFCKTAPTKVLLAGADLLLTAYQLSPVMVEKNTKTP